MSHPRPITMVGRALLRHCPWCGQGKLFPRWFKPVRRCPRCGLVIERGEGSMLGSMSVNMGATMLILIAFVLVWLAIDMPDVQLARILAAGAGVAVFVPIALFPVSKTLWAAIDVWFHDFDNTYADPDERRRLERGE